MSFDNQKRLGKIASWALIPLFVVALGFFINLVDTALSRPVVNTECCCRAID